MNNKNIAILTISVLAIAIAFLVLTIFKGKEMKEWFKKNVLCCFGKKEEEKVEEKPIVNQGQSSQLQPYTKEQLEAIRDNNDKLIATLNQQNQHLNELKEKDKEHQSQFFQTTGEIKKIINDMINLDAKK